MVDRHMPAAIPPRRTQEGLPSRYDATPPIPTMSGLYRRRFGFGAIATALLGHGRSSHAAAVAEERRG